MDEQKLIRLFSDLTGEPEGPSRNVVMYLDMLEHEFFPRNERLFVDPTTSAEAPETPVRVPASTTY